ncbi:TetR/AcrR family transcriptional regulator [Tardiphaga sp. 71_E8_N1_1]|uniref:TetR/AcrR family transcriptional regulator n=1 Tax=Tardiphaga sp. 71_E8_N1_1 TaxID=3240784 RepID=UPI003F89198D
MKSAKGLKRQSLLLDAALRIIARDGHYQLTLRNVGIEAKCGHAAVRYYFGSRDALMCAVSEFAGDYIARESHRIIPRLEAAAEDPSKFARIITRHNIEILIKKRNMGLVVFEMNFAAAREEYLRPIIYKWGRAHSELFSKAFVKLGSKNAAADYSFMLNTINGLLISQLFLPRRDFEEKILSPAVERLTVSIATQR